MPFIGATVAWVITLVMIVGGILIVFAFGISFGNDVVHQWTVSILIAVFTNMTITQSIPVSLAYHSLSQAPDTVIHLTFLILSGHSCYVG